MNGELIAFPLDDYAVHQFLKDRLKEAGGTMKLKDLELMFLERFKFKPFFAEGESEIRKAGVEEHTLLLQGDLVILPMN